MLKDNKVSKSCVEFSEDNVMDFFLKVENHRGRTPERMTVFPPKHV